tara:strand:+ start:3113 stop:3379 length:267 start_codon:yes stop_codon:yes gene_type:complete
MMAFVITAFVWTSHPTLPLGFIGSNHMYKSQAMCEAEKDKNEAEFIASVGNHILTSTNPPLKVNKIYKLICMTPIEITRLNTLLGHNK